jgi:hypothetical protein
LKIGLTTITTEGDKVQVVGLLKSDESLGHGWRLRSLNDCVCDGRHPVLCLIIGRTHTSKTGFHPNKRNTGACRGPRLVWGTQHPIA